MFDQYYSWYYENLNKILVELIEAEPETSIILDILNFDKEHAQIMSEEFHIPKSEVVSLIGEENKEKLLKDYLNLIISMTNNWMDNVHNTERDIFLKRNIPPDTDGDGRLFLQGSKVVFQMFSQQCDVAASSGQAKILLGVIEHFCGLLVDRSAKWQILINEELSNYFVYLDNQDNMEFNGGFIEYLIAVGNDQINSCDLLESLGNKFVTYVSSKYKDPIKSNLNLSIEKSIDVSETVRDSLLQLIYNDVKPIFDKIFTKSWYLTGDDLMKQLVNTMEEYFHEFKIELHKEIYDSILEDSFNDIVILKYLQRLKNSVKFNNKKISDVIKRDLKILYGFFINYLSDNYIEQQFRIFEILMELIDLGSNPSNQRLIIEKFNNEYLNDFNDFSILFLNDILKNCNTYSDKKISLILNELENDKKKFTEYVGGEENIVLSFMSKY
ncbi:hypothetical protein PACTADRAFT_50090 [Pachysolen tannophilus NRRL Y-2460]|uniref:Uncharacterized protein n=1 Tax=Pachysolen tannophilus NRRL Y-2460 TaxID=669874 RepID=A0A1E4TUA6_PACTA|nr:hypothetical protein PACTADRAFT_50090 [Pachysolen tannophilus NRRL Y-2460]